MKSNNILLKYQDCSQTGQDVEGFLVVTSGYWRKKKADFETLRQPLHSCNGEDDSVEWPDGPTLLSLIEAVPLSASESDCLCQVFKLGFYPFIHDDDEDGAEIWRAFALAGSGETGFLDNVGIMASQEVKAREKPVRV